MRSVATNASVVILVAAACGSPVSPPTTTLANVTGPPPPPNVTCYAGTHIAHDRERSAIFMRRTLDPGASTIRQESVTASNGGGFVTDWVAELTVTGDTFRSTTTRGFHGEGRLEGPPWAWTHWIEHRRYTGRPGDEPTEQIEGWLDGDHLRFVGRVLQAPTGWTSELDAIDCADYQPRVDALDAYEMEIGPSRDP